MKQLRGRGWGFSHTQRDIGEGDMNDGRSGEKLGVVGRIGYSSDLHGFEDQWGGIAFSAARGISLQRSGPVKKL